MEKYIEEYQTKLSQDDSEFSAHGWLSSDSLLKYLVVTPGQLEALRFFKLSGGALAKIVFEIGGAEMYQFDHIPIDHDVLMVWNLLSEEQKLKEPFEARVDLQKLALLLEYGEFVLPVERLVKKAVEFKTRFSHGGSPIVSADVALGMLIQLRAIEINARYVAHLPHGDDTYFDYYPGDMYYLNAVME